MKKRPHDLTAKRLRELLVYNPETGIFKRRIDAHNGRFKAGEIVGSKDAHGYLTIWIDKTSYKAHRLAWLYAHGKWPDGEIDHKNGLRSDNRLTNLRPANSSQQKWNSKKIWAHNTLGVRGVYRAKDKFVAYITIKQRRKYLGTFATLAEAADARSEAEDKYYGPFTRAA